tara:strand:- start:17 stop:487 length:471 start_codon:yes stop_codon:yes gene_type:complete
MPVVDSNTRLLNIPTVITMAADELRGQNNLPLQATLLGLARETSLENADVVQMGNTIFVGHTGKSKQKTKMVGRAFNVDTGRNFIKNCLQYISYLQEKGITHYSSQFEGTALVSAVKVMQRRLMDTDTKMYLGRTSDDKYVIFIKIGEESLKGMFG